LTYFIFLLLNCFGKKEKNQEANHDSDHTAKLNLDIHAWQTVPGEIQHI
jgi:hypothetical protein